MTDNSCSIQVNSPALPCVRCSQLGDVCTVTMGAYGLPDGVILILFEVEVQAVARR